MSIRLKANIACALMLVGPFCGWQNLVYAEEDVADKVKELSGISIVGNKEAPKSLYIVPWKNSEAGVESSLSSGLLDESLRPIDKEVFLREIEFYSISKNTDK